MEKECLKVSIITIIVNIILSFVKILSGFIGRSSAMISDGVHSLSDVLSTFIVIVGLKLSKKSEDNEHPYGHERFENVASIILSFLLISTGIFIGIKGFSNLYNNKFVIPTILPLIGAIISILVKEWMYYYTIRVAKKYDSDAMKADAWHHRSDALSSIGSLVGIFATMMGLKFMDLVASIIIAIVIIKTSVEIFKDSIDKMIDTSCNEETIDLIKDIVLNVDGVISIDDIKTRLFGSKIYVDLEISAEADISFLESHNIAHMVHDKLEKEIPNIKHCMVHMNPNTE